MTDDLETGAAGPIDTSIAADAKLAGDAAAPTAKPSIADAGAAFLARLKPEQLAQELSDLALDEGSEEGGDAAEEGTGAEVAAEAITRPEDGATWKPELGRWVDESGKIVAGAAPEGAPASRAPVAAASAAAPAPKASAPAAKADAPAAGSGPLETITLPGHSDRGEEDLELEIDDPLVAERLRRLAKDGLRGAAFREQRAALDAEKRDFQDATQAVADDPLGFVIQQMSPDRQIEVARALILEHLDVLMPEIDELAATPGLRSDKRLELQKQITKSASEAGEIRNARAAAGQIIGAVEALLPEDVDPADARDFMQFARQYLGGLAAQGQSVTPENVKTLLARQLKFAGFAGQPAPAAPKAPAARPAVSAVPAVPVAKPATAAARAIAARSPTVEEATRTAQRVRRVQTQRAAATRVAPAGAGAAPVSVPLLPPEAKRDVKTASRFLQKQGLSDTWAPAE